MIHLLALLTDLLTDSSCVHSLARNLFSIGVANSGFLLLLGLSRIFRLRKLNASPAAQARS